jgi:deazaflavin-dependent oxidoreductase (nitroreductase family)
MDLDRAMTRINPLLSWLLRSPFRSLVDRQVMLLTVTGRRSGRRYTIPVGYQRRGERIMVLVSKARRKQWWRNYREPGSIEVWLRGARRDGLARVVAAGSQEFRTAFESTLRRMPWLGGQFGIAYARASGLTSEQCATLAREAAAVEIMLDG